MQCAGAPCIRKNLVRPIERNNNYLVSEIVSRNGRVGIDFITRNGE